MCANNVLFSFFFFFCKRFLSSLKISKGFVFWRFSILRPRNWKLKAVRCGRRRNETKRARRIRERGGGGRGGSAWPRKTIDPKTLSLSLLFFSPTSPPLFLSPFTQPRPQNPMRTSPPAPSASPCSPRRAPPSSRPRQTPGTSASPSPRTSPRPSRSRRRRPSGKRSR